ncbi:MAG TPA: hypothetical protein VIL36_07595 [Acidimicrobiales bacterium]
MTEPLSQIITVHGLLSGPNIGELNKEMWEPLPLEPLADGAARPGRSPSVAATSAPPGR